MPKRKRKNGEDGGGGRKNVNVTIVKYTGVYKSGKRFKAVITIDREGHYLGTFDTSREAAQAYDHAAIQAGHPISKLNFLDQVPKLYKPKNSGLNPRNTTGFRGVCNNGNRVQAQIQIEKRTYYLGQFDTTKEAALAYDLAAIQAKRPTSELNFPDLCRDGAKDRVAKEGLDVENECKYKGVKKIGKKFRAVIKIDGESHYLGMFDTLIKAARAYDRAAMQAGRPPTKLNFQDKIPRAYKPKRKKLSSTNTIGYRGVNKNGTRFKAQIHIGGKGYYLGLFDTTKEAAIAFDLAALQAKRPKSDLNFPDMIHVKKEILKSKNRQMVRSNNETGFKGVTKSRKKFQARIMIHGQSENLGTFTTARDAAMAYDMAYVELSGKSMYELNTLLNFPNGLEEEEL